MATTASITTAEQLIEASDLGPCELVRGELVMLPPAFCEHGTIGVRVIRRLANFVEPNGLGDVLGPDAGFRITRDLDTVRVPDVAFVRAGRAPLDKRRSFFEGAPDLAVEIISPTDRASEVNAKAQEWLDAGCRMVWVVDPETRIVTVHQGRAQALVLRASDTLSGRRLARLLPPGGRDLRALTKWPAYGNEFARHHATLPCSSVDISPIPTSICA